MDPIAYLSTATTDSIQCSRCSMKTEIHRNRSVAVNIIVSFNSFISGKILLFKDHLCGHEGVLVYPDCQICAPSICTIVVWNISILYHFCIPIAKICICKPEIIKKICTCKQLSFHFQSVKMNPDLAHGLQGTLSTDHRMVRVCDLGGTVESPVPSLKDIKKSYAIW